jgi:hypothetical protein
MQPKNPLLIRTAEYYRGETQIDIRRIEMSPRYNRPPCKPVNEKQFHVRLSAFGPGTSSKRYRTEPARTLDEDYGKHCKICTDGSKMGDKVGYAIMKEERMIKKRKPELPSPVTKEYQVTKRPTTQQKKRWARTSQPQPQKDIRQTT